MDLTQIETCINAVIEELASLLKADDFGNALAVAELVEILANARQGMK